MLLIHERGILPEQNSWNGMILNDISIKVCHTLEIRVPIPFFSWALQFWDLIFSLFVSEKIWYTSYSKTHLRMQITTALLSDISAFMKKKGASIIAAETHSYNYV